MQLAQTFAFTDKGRVRKSNQDSILANESLGIFVVADGVGGGGGMLGEIASKVTVKEIENFITKSKDEEDLTWPFYDPDLSLHENRLVTAVRVAHQTIMDRVAQNQNLKGMMTTMVGILFVDGNAHIAHVGDSRVYRCRNNKMEQVTVDHSLLNDKIKENPDMTPEEIANFPNKNVITRALGDEKPLKVGCQTEATQQGDVYLICSDGLHGFCEDSVIEQELLKESNLNAAGKILFNHAMKGGGRDNCSIILIKCA